jgi:hypothetical protein
MLGLECASAGGLMAKRMTTENQLALVRELRSTEASPMAIARLEELFKSPSVHGMAVKSAAELAEKWDAKSLGPAMGMAAEALSPDTLGGDANKRDPGCEGKDAVLRALVSWDADLPALFVKAAQWHQSAPVMNGSRDVAAECRGLAALGIVQTRGGALGTDGAIMLVIDLLADEEPATRVRAAQALGMWRGPEALPVLRLKAHVRDEVAEVLGEVLASILRHDSRAQLEFVARFLDDEDQHVIEAAAVALGESRQPAALAHLTTAWDRNAREIIRTSILMAIALLRSEESLAWLLAHIAGAKPSTAGEMLQALRIYRGDERIVARIGEAAEKRKETAQLFAEIFH